MGEHKGLGDIRELTRGSWDSGSRRGRLGPPMGARWEQPPTASLKSPSRGAKQWRDRGETSTDLCIQWFGFQVHPCHWKAMGAGESCQSFSGPQPPPFKMKRLVCWSQAGSVSHSCFRVCETLALGPCFAVELSSIWRRNYSWERGPKVLQNWVGQENPSQEAHHHDLNTLRKVWPSNLKLELSGKIWTFIQGTLHQAPVCAGYYVGQGSNKEERTLPFAKSESSLNPVPDSGD